MRGLELTREDSTEVAIGEVPYTTYLIFRKRRVPQSYVLPCSVFQIKVIRLKLFKILEKQ